MIQEHNKELREAFELETKKHHDLIGEYHLPSWDYVFWLEDFIKQLRNTSFNSEYTKCSKEIIDLCQNGASDSDIIDYLQKHF